MKFALYARCLCVFVLCLGNTHINNNERGEWTQGDVAVAVAVAADVAVGVAVSSSACSSLLTW